MGITVHDVVYTGAAALACLVVVSPAYVVDDFNGTARQYISGYVDTDVPTELLWAPPSFRNLQRFILSHVYILLVLTAAVTYKPHHRTRITYGALSLCLLIIWTLLWVRRYSANQQLAIKSVSVRVPLAAQISGGILLFLPTVLIWTTGGATMKDKKNN